MFDLYNRLSEGVPRERFKVCTGRKIEAALDTERVAQMSEFLILDQTGLRVMRAGRMRLNAVLERVLA